ncbi:MAG: aminotransferase class V-fold PLP-dependent enzyme [Eubacteriaceae bacterium]|nr:aminotransferase class V-fold PLP-dependent enzyme [Eubacteriaceae bacterium]
MYYFDNAATTFPKPESVYAYMDAFYRKYGVSAGRGQYELSNHVHSMIEETRILLYELFHCTQDQGIVFTPTATEGLNIVLKGLSWQNIQTVYVTPFEHNAVTRVLEDIKKRYRIEVIQLAVDIKTLEYDLEKIKYQFQERRPDVVIMTHASNVCGLLTPVNEICKLAKDESAITIVDLAQTAGLIDLDFSRKYYDFGVFAGHKTLYGPFGASGIILNKKIELSPLLFGGTGIDSANPNLPDSIPERFEVGSINTMAIAGLNAALKWSKKMGGTSEIRCLERQHLQELIEILNNYSFIKIIGFRNCDSNVGVVSINVEGYISDEIGNILNEQNIAVRTGLHCAPTAHHFLNTFPSGTVRFSVGYFTGEKDFEALIKALNYIEINM